MGQAGEIQWLAPEFGLGTLLQIFIDTHHDFCTQAISGREDKISRLQSFAIGFACNGTASLTEPGVKPPSDPKAGGARPGRRPRGLLGSSLVVGSMTMLSRVLGLIRDIVFARVIGADGLADAFFVAFKIPNFLRRLFAEGAFSQAFVPVLSEYREKGSLEAVQALVNRVCGALGSVLILLTILVVVGAPVVAFVFAPGFWGDDLKFDAATGMIRVTFPYLLFISLTGLAGGILNSYDRFAVPAFTPVWLNVCMIGAALIGAAWWTEPAYALAWGVFVAGLVQMLFQLPFLMGLQLLPRPELDWGHEGVRRILRLMGPAIFGVSVSQINLLLDTVIASFLPTGSVSWLYYSDRLSELPLGVFGVAIGTVILPNLSRQHAGSDPEKFSATLDWAIRMILLVAVPACLALVILAEPILTALFYDGEQIDQRDIFMSALSLRAYALGLVAFMLIKVLAPGYYARQDTRTPVRIGITAMVCNMVLNILFVVPLHLIWQIGHVGLALATSLAAFVNGGLLLRGLQKSGIYRAASAWRIFALQILLANVAMTSCLWLLTQQVADWQRWDHLAGLLWLMAVCCAGFAVYAGALFAAGLRLRDLRGHKPQHQSQ